MKVLVIDIGGTNVKLLASGEKEPRSFPSDMSLTASAFVKKVREVTQDWEYAAVSLGVPGVVGVDGPIEEPGNLGDGWVGFNFSKAFGVPVRVINDAAMQALGSYEGGRMLFLGLGTGLGSTLVSDHVIVPLELGCLPFRDSTLGELLGKEGLERVGPETWQQVIHEAVSFLGRSLLAEHVVLGGGNAAIVDPLPNGVKRGGNENAFVGGFRLWDTYPASEAQGHSNAHIWGLMR
jgi:polyphosphate glucokinase